MSERFTFEQLAIVRFCAKECELQQSGEVSVGFMVEAWEHAQSKEGAAITATDIAVLGAVIDPEKNANGLREVGVRVGFNVKMDWKLVPDALAKLLDAQDSLTPEEFFYEYEEIHPFRDGNGRTGQILYNWLRCSLDAPVFAPNFWDDERREGLPVSAEQS